LSFVIFLITRLLLVIQPDLSKNSKDF